MDSPHRGANVPRGVIAALIDIRNYSFAGFSISEDVPKVEEAYQVLNSPAARQMLLYSGEGSNTLVTGHGPTYNSFQYHLNVEQGMPTQTIQNVAVAKGGGTGIGQFGSASPILNVDASTFNILNCITDVPEVVGWYAGAFAFLNLGLYAKLKIDINAMPTYVTYSLKIYERKIRLIKTLPIIPIPYFYWDGHETHAETVNFYDGVQGGTYDISSFMDSDDSDEEDFITNVINGEYEPCVDLEVQTFAFIPTVSALNMGNFMGGPNGGSPNVQIDPVAIVSNTITSFDKAFILDPSKYPLGYTAPNNESHLDLTPSNVFPFSLLISPDFNAVNENSTVHGYTFNFGYSEAGNVITKTTDRITQPITISGISSANGALWINRADNLENINNTNNPQSTSDHFPVELTRSCDFTYGLVTVNQYGSIVIGEDNAKTADLIVRENAWIEMNEGIIEVKPGSKLIIDAGGELRLNNGILRILDGGEVIIKLGGEFNLNDGLIEVQSGGKVISEGILSLNDGLLEVQNNGEVRIESGGKLIYEMDTQIELNGHNAVLSLGGLTHIGDNALFTFSHQGSEGGYIRMLQEGFWGQRFSAGTSAQIKLAGNGDDDLVLYLEESADFWEFFGAVEGESYNSEKFEYVEFKDCKIVMEEDSRIVLLNKSNFIRSKIESLNSAHNPRGVTPSYYLPYYPLHS